AHPNDWSHTIWKAKAKAYSKLRFPVIAPSRWMAESVKDSKLLGMREVYHIPNTLDTSVFRPHAKGDAKRALGLRPENFILLSGFMPSRKDLHKGTSYLLEALELFAKDNSSALENIELVVFGNRDTENMPDFPVKTTFLGTISSDEKLAQCYSAADGFLAPSLEDNLPNTVLESLSCGTPVIAFTTGGIPDMVDHLKNGYLAQYKSSRDLKEGIEWLFAHPDRQALDTSARRNIEERFSEQVVARRHLELYEALLLGS
ncbi:MAG TPA: glycosyltransferase, partial [Sphingobacteriaceae bacterium]